MLQATRLVPQGQGLAPVLLRRAPQLVLDWDLRQKSRFDALTSDQQRVGVFLPRGTVVRGGDVLVTQDGALLRVVADLIEETHVRIEVPGIMGADRSSFIQVQLQALLPDVPLRATWEGAAQQPLLPKPFALHAVGVARKREVNVCMDDLRIKMARVVAE